MKKELLIMLVLLISVKAAAQDTIFVKSGDIIPAVIVSKDNTEIKYKKFGQREPAAVYSVFVSDIRSIHYSDGIVADYTATVSTDNRLKRPVELAPLMGIGKISFGTSYGKFNMNTPEALTEFWHDNLKNNTDITSNPVFYPFEFRMNMVLGQAKRHWIGSGLELIFTSKDAMFAVSFDGKDEIRLNGWYYNIPMYYGRTINHKKTLVALFEPALNLAFFGGNIMANGTNYELKSNLGTGASLTFGIDWLFSKRVHASFRAGQRWLKIKESHEDKNSSTGFSTFYINPLVDKDLLVIKNNGTYVSAGLYFSMYYKMKGVRME